MAKVLSRLVPKVWLVSIDTAKTPPVPDVGGSELLLHWMLGLLQSHFLQGLQSSSQHTTVSRIRWVNSSCFPGDTFLTEVQLTGFKDPLYHAHRKEGCGLNDEAVLSMQGCEVHESKWTPPSSGKTKGPGAYNRQWEAECVVQFPCLLSNAYSFCHSNK